MTGVLLEGGEQLAARDVVTTAHPAISFLRLLDRADLPPDFVTDIERWRTRSGTVKINLAVDRLPEFTAKPGFDPAVHGGTIVLAESLDEIEGGFQDAVTGRASRRPFADICIPSVFDDSLAPAGHHVVSMFTQWVPHDWSAAPHSAEIEAYADAVVARMDEVAPGLHVLGAAPAGDRAARHGAPSTAWSAATSSTASCRRRSCSTPVRRRATPTCGRRSRGLYQAGSGTHGGGGVTGIPGRNVVRQVLHDLRRDRLRRPRRPGG